MFYKCRCRDRILPSTNSSSGDTAALWRRPARVSPGLYRGGHGLRPARSHALYSVFSPDHQLGLGASAGLKDGNSLQDRGQEPDTDLHRLPWHTAPRHPGRSAPPRGAHRSPHRYAGRTHVPGAWLPWWHYFLLAGFAGIRPSIQEKSWVIHPVVPVGGMQFPV